MNYKLSILSKILCFCIITTHIACDATKGVESPKTIKKTVKVQTPVVKTVKGELLNDGKLYGVKPPLKSTGEPYFLEPSAVIAYQDNVYLSSEKPSEGAGLFKFMYELNKWEFSLKSVSSKPLRDLNTIQDYTLLPNDSLALLVTSFELAEGEDDWQSNHILASYNVLSANEINVVNRVELKGVEYSGTYRTHFQNAFKAKHGGELETLKVTGVAALEDVIMIAVCGTMKDKETINTLLFYPYTRTANGIEMGTRSKMSYDLSMNGLTGVRENLEVTSIEYMPLKNALLITTAYDDGDAKADKGGYLWLLSLKNTWKEELILQLVVNENGTPLELKHKPGGVTTLENGMILIVNDDDELVDNIDFQRESNQAYFTIIGLEEEVEEE